MLTENRLTQIHKNSCEAELVVYRRVLERHNLRNSTCHSFHATKSSSRRFHYLHRQCCRSPSNGVFSRVRRRQSRGKDISLLTFCALHLFATNTVLRLMLWWLAADLF